MLEELEIEPGDEMLKAKSKSIIVFILKILFAVGLLVYFIDKINITEIENSIISANLFFLFIAILLLPLNLYLQFLKWQLTCKTVLNENDNSKILSSLFYGLSAGAFTPARIGEYFGRGIALKEKSIVKVTIATALDKFFPLAVILIIGIISSSFFISKGLAISFRNIFLSFAGIIFLVILLYLFFDSNKNYIEYFKSKLKRIKFLEKNINQFQALKLLDKNYTVKMSILSFLFYLCFVLQFVFLIAAFSNHLNLIPYLQVVSMILFAKVFIGQFSIGELGVREGVSIFFLTKIGELSQTAFSAAFFVFFINILIPSLIGLLFIFKSKNA